MGFTMKKTEEERPMWVYLKRLCCTKKRKTKKEKKIISYLASLCHFPWIRASPSQLLHARLLFRSLPPTLIPVISETHRCLWEERLTALSMDEPCRRFVLMCRENQGVSTSQEESALLLYSIIGQKPNTPRGDEWRWTNFEHAHICVGCVLCVSILLKMVGVVGGLGTEWNLMNVFSYHWEVIYHGSVTLCKVVGWGWSWLRSA